MIDSSRPKLQSGASSSAYLSPYSALTSDAASLLTHDPRTSSQASLHPTEAEIEERPYNLRELYLVYIHGFMGNETSFQSFPAHLHNILQISMRGTHNVHTKIYPKFKTRYHITVATQGISEWLQTIETPNTDLILLGHSMGGLVCAELSFLRNPDGSPKHKILGHVSFDVPFYGLHPGVIGSGIVSLFKPTPATPPPPPFAPAQPSAWDNTFRFVGKYYNDLPKATGKWLMSHLEFGGTLSDWKGLKDRYKKIIELEEGKNGYRVRFVNYYSISMGAAEGRFSKKVAKIAAEDIERARKIEGGGVGTGNEKVEEGMLVQGAGSRPSITLEREVSAPADISKTNGQTATTPSSETDAATLPPLQLTRSTSDLPTQAQTSDTSPSSPPPKEKLKRTKSFKPRKFCLLPSSDPRGLWVPVEMAVDSEVTAHCSLFFFTSPSYNYLLQDAAERIRIWVREAGDERLARELQVRG